MLFKETIPLALALLSATVVAMPYHEWQHTYEDLATIMAARTAISNEPRCAHVEETRDDITYIVRICEAEKGGKKAIAEFYIQLEC